MNFYQELEAFKATHPFQSAQIGNYSFQYLLCGWEDSPCTLVYFVGGTGNPLGWYRHVLAMEGKYQVLLLDYPMGEDRMEPMTDLIAGLLQKLNIQKAVFIGASFGGYIGQLMAKKLPQKTCALVLYATTALTEKGIADLKKQYHYVGALLWLMQHLPYSLLKKCFMKPSMDSLIPKDDDGYLRDFTHWICEDFTKEKDLHMTRLMADIVNLEPVTEQDYAYLEGRVQLILPEQDQAFTEEMQDDLRKLFRGAAEETVTGGHLATLLRAEAFAEQTDAFLKKIRL